MIWNPAKDSIPPVALGQVRHSVACAVNTTAFPMVFRRKNACGRVCSLPHYDQIRQGGADA